MCWLDNTPVSPLLESLDPPCKGIEAYPVDKFELVLFGIKLISNTCTVVFNKSKVHDIRYLTV